MSVFMRVALYGGSFNPIHLGHLSIARAVAERLQLDRVVFLPTSNPPHKVAGDLAPAEHRAAMVKLAIAGEPLFEFSDCDMTRPGPTYTIETVTHFREQLRNHKDTKAQRPVEDGVGTTSRCTLEERIAGDEKAGGSLRNLPRGLQICGDVDWFLGWIIGADSLIELPTWHRPGELIDTCQIITASRPGYDVIDWHKLGETFSPAQIEKLHQGVIETPRIDISSTEIRKRIHAGESIRSMVPVAVEEYILSNRLYQ